MRRLNDTLVITLVIVAALVADGCSRRRAANTPQPQPAPFEQPGAVALDPPAPPASQPIVDNRLSASPLSGDELAGRNLEDLNRDNPLRPAFFQLEALIWTTRPAQSWPPTPTCSSGILSG